MFIIYTNKVHFVAVYSNAPLKLIDRHGQQVNLINTLNLRIKCYSNVYYCLGDKHTNIIAVFDIYMNLLLI